MAHRHIIGGTGTGKSTFAKQQLIDEIKANHAVCYFDPHGYDTDHLLQFIPFKRRHQTIVFDPTKYAIPWNPLQAQNIPLTADTFTTSIRVSWGFTDISTSRLSGVLYNSIVALMAANQSLFGMYLLLVSPTYRDFIIPKIKDPVVQRYWAWLESLPIKQFNE